MPRLYTKDGYDDDGVMSLIIDLCAECWKDRETIIDEEYDGICDPDVYDKYGAEHPDYDDCDYDCDYCYRKLTFKDD